MVCVFPGLEEVLARFLLLTSILIREDLPTLERPMKAYSGRSGDGHLRQSTTLCINVALLMIIQGYRLASQELGFRLASFFQISKWSS